MALVTAHDASASKMTSRGEARVNRWRAVSRQAVALNQGPIRAALLSVLGGPMDVRTAALFRMAWPRQVVFLVLIAVALFAPAGTLHFWLGWTFLAMFVACSVGLGLYF